MHHIWSQKMVHYDLDKRTTHPKFDLTRVRTHDLQIMTVQFMYLRHRRLNHLAIKDLTQTQNTCMCHTLTHIHTHSHTPNYSQGCPHRISIISHVYVEHFLSET